MSPLTRSLLALAVLFVAAEALESNCNERVFGEITNDFKQLKTVTTPARGGRVSFDDDCASSSNGSKRAVGEVIKACNVNSNGAPPDIQEVNHPYLSPVDVVCSDQCLRGADVYIILYCYAG